MPEPIPLGQTPSAIAACNKAREIARRGSGSAGGRFDDDAGPDFPGHPDFHHRTRVTVAVNRWKQAVPRRYAKAEATLPEVIAWADASATDPHGVESLLLTGSTGTGKTHQAFGALRRIAETGPEDFTMTAVAAADFYASLRPGAELPHEVQFARYAKVRYLLLDDWGTATALSGWTEEISFRLINHRYNECLPTIFTTNYPVAVTDDERARGVPELRDVLSDRIISRLAQMAPHPIGVTGHDRRFGIA